MDISAYQQLNIRMSSRGKRPLRNLTPADKVRAIQRIHNGETKASVSRDIGVPESTLRGWCKNEQKLRFMTRQIGNDQSSVGGMENPPEKRIKFENQTKIGNFTNLDDYSYNRLLVNGLEFPVGNSNSNSFLEKIAFAELIKKNCRLNGQINNKPLNNIHNFSSMLSSLPASRDLSQMSLVQNLNYLSLLNTNVTKSSESITGNPLQKSTNALNAVKLEETNDKYKNVFNIPNVQNIPNIPNILSVKDWAREPLENVKTNSNVSKRNSDTNKNELKNNHSSNDTNNNDVNSKFNFQNFARFGVPQAITNVPDQEEANTPLLEWCKMFNASLNFLAMAAAASTINVPQTNEDNVPLMIPPQYSNPIESLVLQHLTSSANSNLLSESYFDSEPEDLSIRSTTSTKLSSPANSRSQSPVSFESATYSDSEH